MTSDLNNIQKEKGKASFSKAKTKSCFFCLRDLKISQSPGPACKKIIGGKQVSLKNVLDFLKFYSSGNENLKKLNSNCDSMVLVCHDCSEMIHEFSQLYQVMEETRLRLNWCLQKLHDVMMKVEVKNQSRKLPKDMIKLRDEAKGEIKNATSFPRVKLKRVVLLEPNMNEGEVEVDPTREDTPRVSTGFSEAVSKWRLERRVTSNKPKKISRTKTIVTGKRKSMKRKRSSKTKSKAHKRKSPDSKTKTATLEGKEKKTSSIKKLKARPAKTTPPATATTSHVSCPYCRAEFPSHSKTNGSYYGTWTLRNHMLKYHLETFFPKHKHDTISDLQFRRILGDLLFRDFMAGKACPICDWPFGVAKSKNHVKNYLLSNKSHFIDAHFKELEEKLEEIQCDPDLKKKLAKVKSQGRMCKNKCGVYLGTGHAEQIHLKNGCLYTKKQDIVPRRARVPVPVSASASLRPSKISNSNSGKALELDVDQPLEDSQMSTSTPVNVKMEVEIENEFPAKRIKLEPNEDLQALPEPDTWLPDSDSYSSSDSDDSETSSSDSSGSYSSTRTTSSSSGSSISVSTSSSTPTKVSSKVKKSRIVDKSPLACPYCRAKFIHYGRPESDNRSTRLRLHHLNYHCEHFFPNLKLPTVTDLQYKKLLVELLFQSLITEERSCRLCKISFGEPSMHEGKGKDIGRQKLHILRLHFKELEEQLQRIQEDPELSAKLEICNPFGRMCKNECGVYIQDNHSAKAHDRFHCIRYSREKQINSDSDARATAAAGSSSSAVAVVGTWTLKTTEQQRTAMKLHMKAKVEECTSLSLQELRFCPYCNFKCKTDRENLFRHVARQHSEHFFLDLIPHVDVSVEEIQRLRKIFEDILFPELMPGVGDTCIYCKKVFNCHTAKDNRYSLRLHLVHQHEIKLREKLKTILDDAELEEKLNGFNGEFCRCGMYFPAGESRRKLMYHKRYMCKFLPSTSINSNKDQEQSEEVKVKMEMGDENEKVVHNEIKTDGERTQDGQEDQSLETSFSHS